MARMFDDGGLNSTKVNPVSQSSHSKVGGISAIAPVQNYKPQVSPYAYTPPVQQRQSAPANIPAPAPAPVVPQAKPVLSESDWLAGDGEYQTQLGQFEGSLKDFLDRLATQRSDFTTDFNTATAGLGRNKDQATLGLGEDFTSRGLANSGLFQKSRGDMNTNFETQEKGLGLAKTRAEADFTNQETDKRKATEQAKGNSKLASLGRMSMNQSF